MCAKKTHARVPCILEAETGLFKRPHAKDEPEIAAIRYFARQVSRSAGDEQSSGKSPRPASHSTAATRGSLSRARDFLITFIEWRFLARVLYDSLAGEPLHRRTKGNTCAAVLRAD